MTKRQSSQHKINWQKARANFPKWLSEDEFAALFDGMNLPGKVAELYRAVQTRKFDEMQRTFGNYSSKRPINDFLKLSEGVEAGLNKHLMTRLYYAAELLIFQLARAEQGKPLSKSIVNTLVEVFFVRADDVLIRDGRGRKPKVTTERVKAVLREHGKVTKDQMIQLLGTGAQDESVLTKWAAKTKHKTWMKARTALLKEIETEKN